MQNTQNPDWAWPALIQSLQHEIARLRDYVDESRRESVAAREAHRKELDGLIEQLREVKSHLEPIVEERKAANRARREMVWGWVGRGGWVIILAAAAAAWHYITNHLGGES